ncbi:MAG: hypothetical protein ACRDKS_02845, partial [Actinomycetota bacterium]
YSVEPSPNSRALGSGIAPGEGNGATRGEGLPLQIFLRGSSVRRALVSVFAVLLAAGVPFGPTRNDR